MLSQALVAGKVRKAPPTSLSEAAVWAYSEAKSAAHSNFCSSYLFRHLTSVHSRIGKPEAGKPLAEILEPVCDQEPVKELSGNKEEKELKEIALAFHYQRQNDVYTLLREVEIGNLTTAFDIGEKPLYWLGEFEQNESFGFIRNIYDTMDDVELQKDLLCAIGLHQESSNSIDFLNDQMRQDENT